MAGSATDTKWIIDRYDIVNQHVVSHWSGHHHLTLEEGGAISGRRGTLHRYLWPSEMDVMAKMAGLELTGRFADWHRAPFTADSELGISIWHKAT